MTARHALLGLPLAMTLVACGSSGEREETRPGSESGAWDFGIPIEAEPQREGDAEAGYRALLDEGYVSCGIPASIFSLAFPSNPDNQIPGREGRGAELPYSFNALTNDDGVDLVVQNCFTCHASRFDGELVLGLGDSFNDYTRDPSSGASLGTALLTDPAEKAAFEKFLSRVSALGENIRTRTRGTNPAENIAAVLVAHRDRDTLAWNDEPLLAIPEVVAPADPPPWWRMKKKNAMFYNAAGRGDQTKHLMLASSLCTDTVAEAQKINEYFDDVRAYITSLDAPSYPFAIDAKLAESGRPIFERECAGCHGTYGEDESYPNLLIPLEIVGTDPVIATGAAQFADDLVQWQRESYYGEGAPFDPREGYVAPPLDGIWATAPFFHNGSVPTIALVLESTARPRYWTRSFDSTDFDQGELGWRYTVLEHGHVDEPDAATRSTIYDTTQLAHSSSGHTFGDVLTADERRAVLEYLKTL